MESSKRIMLVSELDKHNHAEVVFTKNLFQKRKTLKNLMQWCPEVESNHRHKDFQSFALPTELSGHLRCCDCIQLIDSKKVGFTQLA